MKVYDDNSLAELVNVANSEGVTIVYDEVFLPLDPNTSIEKTAQGNRIFRTFPRANASVVIRDTGKFLARPFPKVAVVQVSDAAYKIGGEAMFRDLGRRDFDTVSLDNKHVLAEVLHKTQLPSLITDLRKVNTRNFDFLQDKIDLPMLHCGPFALVDFGALLVTGLSGLDVSQAAQYYGIDAQIIGSYYPPSHVFSPDAPLQPTMIRVPLTMDMEEFKKKAILLKKKLVLAKTISQIEQNFTEEEIPI